MTRGHRRRPTGPHQLKITADNGQSTVNGLTFHVIVGGTGNSDYNPQIYEVGPGKTYQPAESLPAAADHAIQHALDAAATFVAAVNSNANRGALVVVYPNNPSANPRQNPRGAYYENLIITSKVKLQGVGPGSSGRFGARLDHRRRRLRRRQPGGHGLVRQDRRA